MPNPPITHRVRLHFRSLSLTNIPFQTQLNKAEQVYAQYGIRIEFGSGMSLGLSDAEAARFEQVDGSCEWTLESGELYQVQQLQNSVSSKDIIVYFINRFAGTTLGCGGHARNRPACIVAANGSQWTMAHEVGHVLLGSDYEEVHNDSTGNLMYRSTPGITANPPCLDASQLRKIKASPCCVSV